MLFVGPLLPATLAVDALEEATVAEPVLPSCSDVAVEDDDDDDAAAALTFVAACLTLDPLLL